MRKLTRGRIRGRLLPASKAVVTGLVITSLVLQSGAGVAIAEGLDAIGSGGATI